MRILIVAAYFPPRNLIASYRPYSWAKYWAEAGHDVTVITAECPLTRDSLDYDLSALNVIRLRDPVWGRKSLDLQDEGEHARGTKPGILSRILARAAGAAKGFYKRHLEKTGILAGNNFPNFWDIWAGKAIKALKAQCFDAVVSTGGPYSVHRVGLYLRTHGMTKKWVCDWRDLWTRNHIARGLGVFRAHERRLERKFHHHADLITTVSEGAKEDLGTITDTPVEVIYNGYLKDDFEGITGSPRSQYGRFTVSYLGTIYKGFRDPEPLCAAVRELAGEGAVTPGTFRIQFASAYGDEYMRELVTRYGLEDYYAFLGHLPHKEALRVEYDSDCVLFLEHDDPEVKGVLTGKLFEYLFVSRDILCIGPAGGTESGKIIEGTGAGKCLGKDTALIKQYLLGRIRDRGLVREKDMTAIGKFDRQRQAEKLLSFLS